MTAGIVQTLIAYRGENYVSDRDALPADVGRLVYTDPFAFLVGAAFDRGMPWKRAWEIPYWIHQEEMLDAALLAAAPLDALSRLLKSLPARPRYGGAGTLKSAAELVMEFGGDAAAVWSGASPSEVRRRLQRIHGVGPGIAAMAIRILRDDWGMFRGQESEIDVKPDVHVMRVFKRAGLIAYESEGAALEAARRLHPAFPGELDWPAWQIGMKWCVAGAPDCGACPLTAICPKRV